MEMVIDTAVKYNDIFMSGVKITIIISILSCFFGLLLGIVFLGEGMFFFSALLLLGGL